MPCRCFFYEIGISYSGRRYEKGKRIGLSDAVRALYASVKCGPLKRRSFMREWAPRADAKG